VNRDEHPTVCFTFDFDALSSWITPPRGPSRPSALSRGEFGARVGLSRILGLLERESIEATFFVPGHTADTFPELCRAIVAGAHEIGHHGYLHERPAELTADEERVALERGIASIVRAVGRRPRGYRAPGWDLSWDSVGFLLDYGFEYDSSMMADDFQLYRCRMGDVAHTDSAYEFGQEVALVEVPVSWALDDFPVLETSLANYDATLANWIADFDFMAANVDNGVYVITFHPQVIGRGARIQILERLIAHMKGTPNVVFQSVSAVVEDWRATRS
jgi:peptidoglycan/xylan/chitin deacetylase (PgdA/CDA1 family)